MLILIYICSNHRGWLDKTSSSKQFLVIWEGNSQVNLARELLLLTQYFHQPYRIIIHRLPPPPPPYFYYSLYWRLLVEPAGACGMNWLSITAPLWMVCHSIAGLLPRIQSGLPDNPLVPICTPGSRKVLWMQHSDPSQVSDPDLLTESPAYWP